MLILGTTGLITAYVLIGTLLLSINLYSNWSWKIKAGTIIVTTIFFLVTYFSFPGLLGWPTSENPPARFKLIASQVQQPNKVTGDSGAVYLWLTQIDDLAVSTPPRAYRMEYSSELHEMVMNATSKLNKGIPQLGEFEDHENVIEELKEGPRSGQISTKIEFYDLPDPLFPDK